MHAMQISVFLIALFLYPSAAVPDSSISGDGRVLISMKATMDDPNHMLDSWRASYNTNHCSWTGVQCDHVGRVLELDLSHLYLSGPFPSQLTNLSELHLLNVSYNNLSGSLPSNISKLRSLDVLDVYCNDLSGALPLDLSYLVLLHLDLGDNSFSGSIPGEYCKLKSIQYLSLSQNNLSGRIPRELGNLGDSWEPFSLSIMDISNNRLSGSLPSSIGKLSGLQRLLINRNQLTGKIPPEIGNCSALISIDLSQNEFRGPIPAEIFKISNLSHLNVSRNHFNESIPTELVQKMKNLASLDFSYNNFSGILQEDSEFSIWDSSYFAGNPYLRVSYVSRSRRQDRLKSGLLLTLGLLIFCSLVFSIGAVISKSRKTKKEGDARSWEMTIFQKLDFGSNDIVGCVKKDNVIGKGGAGVVYRGIMPNGQQIAVKKLTRIGIGSSNDYGFSAEIQTVGKIRHRHIATLLAFCFNHDTNLLVYEYMPNGSLGELLHGNNGGHLQWDTRYKIAIEVAKGLCYLHHDCSPLILHRDVKSNNILLDSNFEAHVADFGLAKLLHHPATPECISSIAGSFGYIAPEYAYTLKVDEKSDVYSYGVVLVELITGKRAVEELEFEEGMNIGGWVKKMTNSDRREVMKIIDPKLSTFSMEEAMHILFVALLCIEEQPVHRPSMREIVHILTHCKPTQ